MTTKPRLLLVTQSFLHSHICIFSCFLLGKEIMRVMKNAPLSTEVGMPVIPWIPCLMIAKAFTLSGLTHPLLEMPFLPKHLR